MLTFKELEEPVSGWALSRIEKTRGGLWEVTFQSGFDGQFLTGSAHRDIEVAWSSAQIVAENADVASKEHRRAVL